MRSDRGSGQLDAASSATLKRFGLCVAAIAGWYLLARTMGAEVRLAEMWVMSAVTVVLVAKTRRERPEAASLNRWDEAVGYVGLASLSAAFTR